MNSFFSFFGIRFGCVKAENKKQKQQISAFPLRVPVFLHMQAVHKTDFTSYGGGREFVPLAASYTQLSSVFYHGFVLCC